jgi:two-component system KDP operon response regulator KdpE
VKDKRILVVDDDPSMCELIKTIFANEGGDVYTAASGQEGLRRLYDCQPQLIILDVMMPGMDGWQLCNTIRGLSDVPILFLSALSTEDDIVHGLDLGAVDYVSKPFTPKVLLARARAALRQAERSLAQDKPTFYDDGHLSINVEQRQVQVAGKQVNLTPTEYRLLVHMFQRAGQTLTHEQILTAVWGPEYLDSPNYVYVYVRHLRRKLECDPNKPMYLVTERGVGYRFKGQATSSQEPGGAGPPLVNPAEGTP